MCRDAAGVYMALVPVDHTSLVADFLCFLDCSSQAENSPYIPWKGLAVIVLMEYLPVAR